MTFGPLREHDAKLWNSYALSSSPRPYNLGIIGVLTSSFHLNCSPRCRQSMSVDNDLMSIITSWQKEQEDNENVAERGELCGKGMRRTFGPSYRSGKLILGRQDDQKAFVYMPMNTAIPRNSAGSEMGFGEGSKVVQVNVRLRSLGNTENREKEITKDDFLGVFLELLPW